MQTDYAEAQRESEPTPFCNVQRVKITEDLSNTQAEAEDEKWIINLFERKLGTDKEKAMENSPNLGTQSA